MYDVTYLIEILEIYASPTLALAHHQYYNKSKTILLIDKRKHCVGWYSSLNSKICCCNLSNIMYIANRKTLSTLLITLEGRSSAWNALRKGHDKQIIHHAVVGSHSESDLGVKNSHPLTCHIINALVSNPSICNSGYLNISNILFPQFELNTKIRYYFNDMKITLASTFFLRF